MTDILKRLGRTELRRLKPGDWIAWSKSNWGKPDERDFAYFEAQVLAHPLRSAQRVIVFLNGGPYPVNKNQLYQVQPVIDVKDMHTQYNYNS
jgi:hypothetical protein